MIFVSGDELRQILNLNIVDGNEMVPDFVAECLSKLDVQIEMFLLPSDSIYGIISEYVCTNQIDLDNTTIIYQPKTKDSIRVAFVNINWDKLSKNIKAIQKLKAFI